VTRFRLESGALAWIVDIQIRDSAVGPSAVRRGTRVELTVVRGHTPRLEDVFRAYTDPETLRFTRTRATVKLAALGTALVSRSEAKAVVPHRRAVRQTVLLETPTRPPVRAPGVTVIPCPSAGSASRKLPSLPNPSRLT